MKRKRNAKHLAGRLLKMLNRESGNEPSIAQFARRHRLKYQHLYRLLRESGYTQRRSHRMLTDKQNAQIEHLLLESDRTRRDIAYLIGCAKSTVDLRSKRLRRRKQREAETEQVFDDRPAECAIHGPVSVWPCVTCIAQAAKEKERG